MYVGDQSMTEICGGPLEQILNLHHGSHTLPCMADKSDTTNMCDYSPHRHRNMEAQKLLANTAAIILHLRFCIGEDIRSFSVVGRMAPIFGRVWTKIRIAASESTPSSILIFGDPLTCFPCTLGSN